jgi:hypothetical protein
MRLSYQQSGNISGKEGKNWETQGNVKAVIRHSCGDIFVKSFEKDCMCLKSLPDLAFGPGLWKGKNTDGPDDQMKLHFKH